MSNLSQARQLEVTAAPVEVAPRSQPAPPPVAEEQLVYARVLDSGMKLGILLLVVGFAIYVFGVLAPHVPVEDLPRVWGLSVKQYLAVTDVHGGWSWVGLLHKGDFLNFVGIAFLAGITIVCYLAVIPVFFKKGDLTYAALAVVEVLVLLLAASGLLKSGGH